MRRAMICVSFMLAIVQVWPLVFGRGEASSSLSAPRLVPQARAAVRVAAKPAVVAVAAGPRAKPVGMPTCYQRYERAYAACAGGSAACQLRAGDNWDVCEATGFWPE